MAALYFFYAFNILPSEEYQEKAISLGIIPKKCDV
tara:strand:+ start:206 stop:310 length:105 start_codon:yes stop_codon:yes gene_type:complete